MNRIEILKSLIEDDWFKKLSPFIESGQLDPVFDKLKKRNKEVKIYPNSNLCFRAFKETPLNKIKVVILGQDPYYTPGVADGLAFSTHQEGYIPPSLENIYKEINSDIYDNREDMEKRSADLTHWAQQGVFLFNTALTVEVAMPGSHTTLWKPFTNEVLHILNESSPIVFMLWGKHAESYKRYITSKNHLVLTSAHPSPLSAHRGFFGCKHFSQANKWLEGLYGKDSTIRW
jgi:uracil-DNA glycosylase